MRDARIDLDFGDGTYPFRMAWGQLAELQEQTDTGPYLVLQRLYDGGWRVEDISNVIRLGLIGGGMTPADALKKTRTYVEDRPPLESVLTAQAVLAAGLQGAPEEKVGKKQTAADQEAGSTTSREARSDSPQSTVSEPSSVSRRKR